VSQGRRALHAWVFDRDSGKLMGDTPLATTANSLHFSPDGETLVAVGDGLNHGVALWDWRRGGQVRGGIPKGLLEGKISDERPEDVAKYKILSLAEGSLADDGTLLTREAKGVLRLFDLGLKPKKDGPKKGE
jgi:WD40 repeat protein